MDDHITCPICRKAISDAEYAAHLDWHDAALTDLERRFAAYKGEPLPFDDPPEPRSRWDADELAVWE